MKVLIIRLGSMGDVILTTPLIEILKESCPEARIEFLVKKEYNQLLEGNPYIDNVISFDSGGIHKGLSGLVRMSQELKEKSFTHIIDLHGNLRSRILSVLMFGVGTSRYNKQAIKRRMLLSGLKPELKHTVDTYLTALIAMGLPEGLPKKNTLPLIVISRDEKKISQELLYEFGVSDGENVIGLAPGAKWATKMWPEESFVETGKKVLGELGGKVILFGGPQERELCENIAGAIGEDVFSVAGETGIKETAALIKRCKVFVSNDSGPMHIATAVGTSVVAIFGPTVKEFGFSPLGKSVVVEKNLSCRPCSLHGSEKCPKGHFKCMKEISANDVLGKVMEMID